MLDFIEWLTTYINTILNSDADFDGAVFHTVYGYAYDSEFEFPQVTIQVINDSENESYTTFEGEEVSNLGLQIDCFAQEMSIALTITEPQRACLVISDKIKKIFQDLKTNRVKTEILGVTRTGHNFSMPIDNGEQLYRVISRYNLLINE